MKSQFTTLKTDSRSLTLDLTQGATLAPALLRRLDQIAAAQTATFNQLVAEFSRGHERDIDWWVSRPITRSIHAGQLFDRCAQLALIRFLIDDGFYLRIYTDSPELAMVLRRDPSNALTVEIVGRWRTRIERLKRHFWNVGSCVFHSLMALLAARVTRRFARPLPDFLATILEVPVLRDSVVGGQFEDNYFVGAMESLNAEQRRHIFFFPTFFRLRQYFKIFGALRRGNANFLIPQDRLRFQDYLFAAGYWFRLGHLVGGSANFAKFDVGPIFDAELRAGRFAQSAFGALLNYRYWKQFEASGIKIRHLIVWYEGRDIDHATSAAINWHMPDIDYRGFRPVGATIDIALTPSRCELEAGVAPRNLCVVGTRMRRAIEADEPRLNVLAAPGFRYRHLPKLRRIPRVGKTTVLIILSMVPALAAATRKILSLEIFDGPHGPAEWWIKRHPGMTQVETEAVFQLPLPSHVRFVEGSLYTWLIQANIVIGMESSALVEAVALGIPVICLGHGNMPSRIPIPAWVDPRLWRLCYDRAEVLSGIKELLKEDVSDIDLTKLQDDLLSPADDAGIELFWDLS